MQVFIILEGQFSEIGNVALSRDLKHIIQYSRRILLQNSHIARSQYGISLVISLSGKLIPTA
ncbi:hypothetical protein CES85_2797 (plasmid) [Ochrobactrum quorumnocens]|uniref:Uncharacterized protein n=1 Tax=Ochrobactrum quorumnocens TaxID=271865 RepID=A0A248UP86_9HYPH|nr:hypothetical protein CES85_2797 [[Ochrobactrum] quorumnocens]